MVNALNGEGNMCKSNGIAVQLDVHCNDCRWKYRAYNMHTSSGFSVSDYFVQIFTHRSFFKISFRKVRLTWICRQIYIYIYIYIYIIQTIRISFIILSKINFYKNIYEKELIPSQTKSLYKIIVYTQPSTTCGPHFITTVLAVA